MAESPPTAVAVAEPRLLVVVPTLDSFPLLPALVASLQGQSYGHWRLLFVDGPSGIAHRQALDRLCCTDSRLSWIQQSPGERGIFGAMNQGFAAAGPHDWLLFWGSDDRAGGDQVLARLAARLRLEPAADLLVAHARYEDASSGRPGRLSRLRWRGSLGRTLAWGSTPPHQATVFGPGARRHLARYDTDFRLAADLDYFLRLSRCPGLRVLLEPMELVRLGDGGVSGSQTGRRLSEVRRAYRRCFGAWWWGPFLLRYGQRLLSLWPG